MDMGNLLQQASGGELLVAVGIALIILSITAGIISLAVFVHSGKKLKLRLEQEYGDNG